MSDSYSANPYAVSTTSLADAGMGGGGDAVAIRKRYLSHEASVKSIGLLYWLGGILGLILAPVYLIGAIALMTSADTPNGAPGSNTYMGIVMIGVALLVAAFAVGQIIVAMGVRKLKPWARIATAVLSGIGLLGFPLGTLISAYFMYLVLSKKGQYVFSPEYQNVIAATPQIRYKTSIIIWILLGLLVALIIVGVIGFAASSVR